MYKFLKAGLAYKVQHRTSKPDTTGGFFGKFEYAHVEDDNSRTLVFATEDPGTEEQVHIGIAETSVISIVRDDRKVRYLIESALHALDEGGYFAAESILHDAANAAHWMGADLGVAMAQAFGIPRSGLDNPAGAGDSVEASRG